MCAEALTQEEIDALLRSHSGGAEAEGPPLTPEEQKALTPYLESFQAAFTDVWSLLTSQSFSVRLDKIESMDADRLPDQCPESVAVIATRHEKDLQGELLCLLPNNLARLMSGAMTGTADFGELEQSAMGEGMGQTFGSLCTQLSGKLKINTQVQSPAVAALETRGEEFSIKIKGLGRRLVCAFLQIGVQDQSGPFIVALSNDVVSGLVEAFAKPQPAPAAAPPKPAAAPPPSSATVQQAVFQPLQEKTIPGKPGNLDLLLDIGLDVRVELGRTGMKIRDVLELGPGSVLELDKLAGEPVDLLINDKLFARGEVVVIDENFGVRVTDILNMEERIQALGEK